MNATARTLACCLVLAFGSALAAPPIWIEAESPAESNFKHFETSSMGKPQLLSGGEWIMKGVAANEVKTLVPDGGVRLKYAVKVDTPGTYTLWARVGWYSARADMRWRVGDGPWGDCPRTYPTINLMELGFFCEVSWARLGDVDLKKGTTTLEIQYPKVTDGKSRMLCALDCFAFVQGAFTPEGPFKPGETYTGALDQQAAKQVFDLPEPKGTERAAVKLNGPWQVARYDDPDMDKDTYVPVQKLPAPAEYQLRWMGFEVPGNPWKTPPLVFGHRLIYRTRLRVPASHKGRGFTLHFSGTHWIVSVFVNGRLAGAHAGVWVPWNLDVSRFIEPGKVNELAVAVKGTYYAFDAKSMGGSGKIEQHRNRPLSRPRWSRWVAPIYPSTKGDGDGYIYGIVNPVTLVSVGDAYTEDVFVQPSVGKKRCRVDVTVRNTADRERGLAVRCEAVDARTGKVEKVFPDVAVACPAGSTKTVTVEDAWADPKLWWPQPNPQLYTLRTTVSENRKPLDVHDQTFGFREVAIQGTGIYINGVRRNFWNWVDVHQRTINQPEEWADTWRQEKNRFMRFSHGRRITRVLKSREERLDFYDRAGVAGRLCTMIDGMFISYNLGERTREKDAQGRPLLVPNEPVWANFRQHMAQVARAYRNHPSVIFHQVENELVYINGMNIYGGYLDTVEELMSAVCEAGRKEDPSRPYTVGGGGDLSGKLEINSPHYPHTALDYYPENAYTIEHYATKIRRWPWDRKKPWVVGESLFANEMQLGAYVAGDEVFRGKEHALRGKAKFLRMIYGGYRWAGVAGFFPWDNLWQFDDSRKIFSDLYACPRKQASRLFAGKENSLLFKIMNDTLSREPVTFEWAYRIGDRRVAGETIKMTIEPGFGKEHALAIPAPDANVRQDGTLTLRVSQAGAETYEDERVVPVLPTGKKLDVSVPVTVLDRSGALANFLTQRGVKFARADSLAATKGKTGLLLVGHDSLTPEEAFGTGLLAFAASGGRVVCLEQEHPPAGSALPAPLRPTQRFAGFVHPQALGTPVFADLGRDDLIDWAGDHPTAKNLYHKPSQGARSLAQCGGDLEFSPLVEVPCGEGVIVVCQLRVGAKLGADPAAEILLRNLVRVYGSYRPSSGTVAVFSPGDPLLAEKVAATGTLTRQVGSLAEALDSAKFRVALVHATPESLQALLDAKARADAFQKQGGWLMLCGLGPKGIERFNRLAGTSHLLRPFRYERVTLPRTDHPLASTLGSRDVALYSPKPLMHGRYWVSNNTFSHVVDGLDFAPFTLPPGASDDPHEYKPTFDDHDPYNFVNGILNDDSWRCIQQIWIDEQSPKPLVFRLRKPDTLDTVRIWNNANYWTIEDIDVILDGDPRSAIRLTLPDGYGVATAKLPKPAPVQKTITLQIRTWRERPLARPDLRLVGIDNVQFLRLAPPEKAVALDSVGGLVVYPNGKGGMLLNQLKFLDDEPRESNAAQKVRLLGVLLQNMGVGSRSAAVVAVPGVNVRFHTINLQEFGNAYLDDRGGKAAWFGAKGQNLATLPRGQQVLADVTYHVVDYRTAPTPDVLMLGGNRAHRAARSLAGEVKGIPVGRKADTLYFLHAANVDRPINDRERAQMNDRRRPFVLPTVLKYVLHYDDGKTAEVPVVLEKHINHWAQQDAVPLPGAQIGWSKPLEALQGKRATLYSMQAPNPRPGVAIKSIDAVRVGERATPVVVAISTGTVVGKKGN